MGLPESLSGKLDLLRVTLSSSYCLDAIEERDLVNLVNFRNSSLRDGAFHIPLEHPAVSPLFRSHVLKGFLPRGKILVSEETAIQHMGRWPSVLAHVLFLCASKDVCLGIEGLSSLR